MATIIDKVMIALGIDASGMQTGADESGKQIDRVEKKADEAKAKLASIGQSVDDFGKKAGHVLMGFVAPVLAAVSVGKMIGGYFSDLAAVAESTGAYNKQLEETRLKKAQLQRVTKDDIEFYKKSRGSCKVQYRDGRLCRRRHALRHARDGEDDWLAGEGYGLGVAEP